ncbi:hypothetical protein F511_00979 [Dorcoceras hygrometricum]|uniref:Uncharacterized protein n=1 Tax=Dorcoceras hygrometricum TaxID=472368 RepID=A0A2Z7AGF2_9LAMI|nr:hypothetical protein F511_00979 [Dorcoceras hygrometricum]
MRSLVGTSNNVNEEYKEAFRTKSYIEICSKIRGGLEKSFSSPHAQRIQNCKDLLEPESLTSILESSSLHPSLVNYFQISQEACQVCELILQNVHQVRSHYSAIDHITKFIKRVPNSKSWTQDQCLMVYRSLATFALRKNPFATMTPKKFRELHDRNILLLHELTSQCLKTKRRWRFMIRIKKVVAGRGARMLGIVLGSSRRFLAKKKYKDKQRFSTTGTDNLRAQLDTAGRGVYILINDFDTMNQLVQRLHDEMEHMKLAAGICVMRKWKYVMLKVLQEFQNHESWFVEQLEDLEKQIYLCFLNINRTRRLVVQELIR